MAIKLRVGVMSFLEQYKNEIVQEWSAVNEQKQISRKDIALKYSASIVEVGQFLMKALGESGFREIIKSKRQAFFGRVGRERKKEKTEPVIDEQTIRDMDAARDRRERTTRRLDQFDSSELSNIMTRLLMRIASCASASSNRYDDTYVIY